LKPDSQTMSEKFAGSLFQTTGAEYETIITDNWLIL